MKNLSYLGILVAILMTGCSAAQKARRDEREKVVQSKGVFCDFVSESDYKDIDVELNLRIAKRCDASKPFNISSYKRVSENPGVLYCCNTSPNSVTENESSNSSKVEPSSEADSRSSKTPPTTTPATGAKPSSAK